MNRYPSLLDNKPGSAGKSLLNKPQHHTSKFFPSGFCNVKMCPTPCCVITLRDDTKRCISPSTRSLYGITFALSSKSALVGNTGSIAAEAAAKLSTRSSSGDDAAVVILYDVSSSIILYDVVSSISRARLATSPASQRLL